MSGILAEFASDRRLVEAAAHMHALGYGAMEAYTPFPIAELDRLLATRASHVPLAVLVASGIGAIGAYLVEWGTTLDYPLRVAGFPLNSLPAFIPIVFESAVLAGSIAAFASVFIRTDLGRWWHPFDEIEGFERSVIDRFFLSIMMRPSHQETDARCRDELSRFHPLRIIAIDGAP